MADHQEVFKKIKDFLSRHATIKVDDLDYGTHLTIDKTEVWMESDPAELTIGYGLGHRHYNPKHDDLRPALDKLFNLLTKRRRITLYSKRDKVFKEKIEIQLSEDKYEELGTQFKGMFPFWQKTTERIRFEEPLIEYSKVEKEITEIYGLLNK
jgi:hypothetical protein